MPEQLPKLISLFFLMLTGVTIVAVAVAVAIVDVCVVCVMCVMCALLIPVAINVDCALLFVDIVISNNANTINLIDLNNRDIL